VGTVVAVVAAVIAYEQVHLASVQNEGAERVALVTLVTGIGQVTQSLATAPASLSTVLDEQRLADAAQGLELVNALHDQVPAIDNYELGVAFEGSGEYAEALKSWDRAATTADPHYRASALRGVAQILYRIGGVKNIRQAQIDIDKAYDAWVGKPDVSRNQIYSNKEFTDLFDIRNSAAPLDCARARSEFADAKRLIAADPASPDSDVDAGLNPAAQVIKHCGSA
jgi:tetratricopeptide (TPR) repeat protein